MFLQKVFSDTVFWKKAGLQYVWPLDEATGLVRQSYSPPWACVPSAHLLPVNGPTQAAGSSTINATALNSASSQYLVTPTNSVFQLPNADFWVSIDIKNTTSSRYIIDLGGTGACFALDWHSSSAPRFFINGAAYIAQWGASLLTNTWYHITAFYSSTSHRIGISVNGGEWVTTSTASALLTSTTQPLYVGSLNPAGAGFYVNGVIGNLMFGRPKSGIIDAVIDSVNRTLYANGVGLDLVRRLPLPYPPGRPLIGIEPILWCEADYGTYQTSGGSAAAADGDPVGYWTDRSVFGNHPVQATSTKRATLKTNQLNGYPVLRFDGVDDYFSGTFTQLRVPFTLFYVAKTVGHGGANNGTLFQCVSDIYNATCNTGTAIFTTDSNPYTHTLNGTIPSSGVWELRTCLFNGASSVIRKNGAVDVSGDAGNTTSGTTFYIANDASLSRQMDGDIAAVMVYPGALTAAQITAVEAWLNAKYAVY